MKALYDLLWNRNMNRYEEECFQKYSQYSPVRGRKIALNTPIGDKIRTVELDYMR